MERLESTSALVEQCASQLSSLGLSIAFAESITGGPICSEFAVAPNAHTFLKGGLNCRAADLNIRLLEAPPKLVEKHTGKLAELAKAMTAGISKIITADVYVGCTGFSRLDGSESEAKPQGTTYIHGLRGSETIFMEENIFEGPEFKIIEQTKTRVAELLLAYIANIPESHIPIKINIDKNSVKNKGNDYAIDWGVTWP